DFALGGVKTLDALGCVDMLSFGSESGDITDLINLANLVDELEGKLNQGMEKGKGFPSARQTLLCENGYEKEGEIISHPNNILALEYILALKKIGSKITPETITRMGSNFNDQTATNGEMASATALRNIVKENPLNAQKYMPESAFEVLKEEIEKGKTPLNDDVLNVAILSRLRTLTPDYIEGAAGVSEGLHNSIFREIRRCKTVEEIVSNLTSKRYTSSRIRRILISLATGVTKELIEGKEVPYIRVLGRNEKGDEILKLAKQTAKIPVIQKGADILSIGQKAAEIFSAECLATDLYSMGFTPMGNCDLEYTENIYSK
ncbi:MAG: nucleotidyltransferase family protein, partial [Clostridia bacterium]|nr:nucleotidyltransferase family protein [Clostridia bacterium]